MEDINKVVENIKDDIDQYAPEVGSDNAEGRVEVLNLTLGYIEEEFPEVVRK